MSASARAASIVIADAQPLVVRGLLSILKGESDFTVLASCQDGNACLQAIRDLSPTLAVLDMALPGQNGLEVLAAVKLDRLATRIVLLSNEYSEDQCTRAIARGAYGVLCKGETLGALLRGLREVASGSMLLPPAGRFTQPNNTLKLSDLSTVLTEREREVVRSVCAGLSNKEIGRQLRLTEGTIKMHLHHIYRKLAIQNRTALATLGQHRSPVHPRTNGSLALANPSRNLETSLGTIEDDLLAGNE